MNNLFPYQRKNNSQSDRPYTRTLLSSDATEKKYHCELVYNNVILQYTLHASELIICDVRMIFELHPKIQEFLTALTNFEYYFTTESIRRVFKDYPHISIIIFSFRKFFPTIEYGGGYLVKENVFRSLKYFSDNYEFEWAIELKNFADGLIWEINHLAVDFSKLEKKWHLESSSLPPWLKSGIAYGGVLLLKVAIKSIVQSIDFDFDFDSDTANDNTAALIVGGDGTIIDCDTSNTDATSALNIVFCGKDTPPSGANSDGYVPDGSISLTATISDITKSFKHFTKNGQDFILYNGAYIQISGSGTVNIGGIKFDKI